jgi:hypothetical protein
MTCEEFERVLPELGSGHNFEQEKHLKSCYACSDLVRDLNAISQQARLLQGSDEPSPWVWNSLEVALQEEGLIRQPQLEHSRTPTSLHSRRLRWLVPLAAAFLVALGVLVFQRGTGHPKVTEHQSRPLGVETAELQAKQALMANEDLQLLKTVAARMPSMSTAYEENLRTVNAYIQDAERSADSDPNDEVAQQYLRNAYEQKAMVYEMALDRSLP